MDAARGWLIDVDDLVWVYGDGEKIRALDGVDIRVMHGEL